MKRAQPEAQLHKAVAAYLRLALKPPTIWTTIGHGGGGKVRGAQLKAMGVMPGWPDILIMSPGPMVEGTLLIGIELKAAKGRASDAQIDMQARFRNNGATYEICRSLNEVVTVLLRFCKAPYWLQLHARV